MTRRIIVPTTARARVDVTSDARNASRAGSGVRACRPLSVSETNARGAAVDPKASLPVASHDRRRQDLCRNVRRVRVGRILPSDGMLGFFQVRGRGRQTKPREIDDSFLEFSRLGFCCKSESAALCAFSNPLFLLIFIRTWLDRTARLAG